MLFSFIDYDARSTYTQGRFIESRCRFATTRNCRQGKGRPLHI